MKKNIIFTLLILILIPFTLAVNDFAYNRLYENYQPIDGFNYSINVNQSNNWFTNIGLLSGVDADQHNNVGDLLTIDESWLESLGNSLWCELVGCTINGNITAAYFKGKFNWTTTDDWNSFDGSYLTFNESKLSSTYYNVTSSTLIKGIIDGGSLINTQHPDANYDGITLNFSEESGSPALDLRVNFTGVEDFSRGVMRYKTGSLSGEYPLRQLWNYDTSNWETLTSFIESEEFVIITMPIFNSINYIKDGVVQMRIYKSSNGNTNNHYYVDWISMVGGYGVPSGQEVDPIFNSWLNDPTFEYNINASKVNITANLGYFEDGIGVGIVSDSLKGINVYKLLNLGETGYGAYNEISPANLGATGYGVYNKINISADMGNAYGIYNDLIVGTIDSTAHGLYNDITGSGDGSTSYGVKNGIIITGNNANAYGVYNILHTGDDAFNQIIKGSHSYIKTYSGANDIGTGFSYEVHCGSTGGTQYGFLADSNYSGPVLDDYYGFYAKGGILTVNNKKWGIYIEDLNNYFGGNTTIIGELNTTGNITSANYFIGDGSQLVNLPSQNLSDYWNQSEDAYTKKSLIINNSLPSGNGTIDTLADSFPDYWIFYSSTNLPSNEGSGVYYMRMTNGTGEGLTQKISQTDNSAPPGSDGTLTMPNGDLFISISVGDTFDIYLQNEVTDDLNKVEIEGDLKVWGLVFNTIKSSIKSILPAGTTTQNPDYLLYLIGGKGADYYTGTGTADASSVYIKLEDGGGYANNGGNGGNWYIDGGNGGTPANNGGNATIFHFILTQGGAGATAGEDGVFRIGTLTNFIEFTYAGLTTLKDTIIDGYLQLMDNDKIYFGTSQDSSIYYDGFNLHINPAEIDNGLLVIDGDGYMIYDSYRWKSLNGRYRAVSGSISSVGEGSYGYFSGLADGVSNYNIGSYIIPDDARINGTVMVMLDFIGTEPIIAGVNDQLRLNFRAGGMTENEGGQYIQSSTSFNVNLSKYDFEVDKYMHINIKNLTNINPMDYFSTLTYRYGADGQDTYNGTLGTPYVWRIKYQTEIV